MSTMGNGGGSPLRGGTMVGLRGLTTITPSKGERLQKKKGVEQRKVDRVEREDERSQLFEYEEQQEEENQDGEVALPSGHAASSVAFEDEAFRLDAKGSTIPPAYSDVDQGNLADAWLMASAAAMAHAQPAQLMKRIKRHDDKSWMVRLGDKSIVVTPEFSSEGYADPRPNGQRNTLWVALLEKAFALREAGSYANLEVGNPARALEALSGKPAKRMSLTERTPADKLFETIREGRRSSQAMVLHTREQGVAQPLHVEHCYAVLDAYERDGKRYLKLYNPWGTNGGQKTIESLIHEVRIEAVRTDCDALFVSGN